MKALIIGITVLSVAILSVLPMGLGWWGDLLVFLRGSLPILALFLGLLLVFTGITDIRDKLGSRKKDPPA
ncbi:MAG: hypothetical protein FWH12_01825 [Treponema sp.]|nr:hypothetical protein [Treponema sp.]